MLRKEYSKDFLVGKICGYTEVLETNDRLACEVELDKLKAEFDKREFIPGCEEVMTLAYAANRINTVIQRLMAKGVTEIVTNELTKAYEIVNDSKDAIRKKVLGDDKKGKSRKGYG